MTNLKVFQDKKELLKSLPALTASDFVVYDTSKQDETKPYVLVSFSFYDEKVGRYTYQIRTGNSLGNFILEVAQASGSNLNTGYYLYDMRTHYYDTELGEWVLYGANTRSRNVPSFLGLKGMLNTIVYATRDVYDSSSTMRPKDSRLLLSGRFRNDTPFDEFFNESHLAQLGYETGDDILRVKYADNNHLLFVIKGSTSPLKAIYSSTYYYNLTVGGTIKGLQCKDGVYTEVSNLQHVASQTLPFDDYVLYSTLDITFQDRLMRMKDYYVVGTRDEIVSVSPESIQIKEPFELEVQTNPSGLEVNILTELPETYNTIMEDVVQLQAGNSYVYEHYFETIDLVGEWARQPLPPKQTIANFYDGNNCRIVYQSGEKECKMLTFMMDEDNKVYWGSKAYGYWYFSNKTKASNFMLYPLTKEGIGEGTSVTWVGSSYSYLDTNVKTYKREADCIFFSNIPIYDSDQTTVLFEAMSYTDLAPYYFHFKSVGFDPLVRIRVGETWEELLQVYCDKSDETTIQSISFTGDYQSTYDKKGTYCLTAHIIVDQFEGEVFSSPFLLNIYDETCLSYPNHLPFPVEDGMKDFLIFKGKTQIGLVSHTGTEGICPYLYRSTSIQWFDNHPDGGYGSTCGTYLYYLNEETNVWEFQSGSESRPYRFPTFNPTIVNGVEDVVYSTMDVYDSTKTNIVYSKRVYQKQDYHISMRKYPVPYELPDAKPLLEEDGAIHYFIAYRGGHIVLTTIIPTNFVDFAIIQKGSSSSTLRIDPSGSMSKVVYRRFDPSTGAWGSPVTETNRTLFNSSYVDTGDYSTLNKALTTNDMVIYTTLPIYLKRSVGDQQTLLRYEDSRLIADENSIPPKVLAIRPTVEPPYTVDTAFGFEYDVELEPIEGIMLKNFEWENKKSYYPAGENIIRLRIQDNRDLWSDWFDYTFMVEKSVIPDNVPIGEYPMKPDGSPYQHYMIYRANNQTGYAYFCFDLKEEIEDPHFFYIKSGSNDVLRSEAGMADQVLADYVVYQSYKEGVWGDKGTLYTTTASGGYFQVDKPKLYNELRSGIYYTTVPIYMYQSDEIFAYPSEPPKFPLSLTVAASHENVWTSDDVTVTTKIHANGQSWHNFKYRINKGDFIPLESDGDLIFTESGDYHLEFFIYNQDNVETKAEVSFKIDKDRPVLSIEETDTHLIFKAIDEHSGLAQLHYRLAENNVFTRSKNFANHLALVLSENGEATLHTNDWISISSGFKLAKPTIGGTYTYELMGVDEVGNTHLIQHTYDLPKINIESVQVSPSMMELKYNQTQQLTVEILPTNHNEELQPITYTSSRPDLFSVSDKGLVKNVSQYGRETVDIEVMVNNHRVVVQATGIVEQVPYPNDLPSLYDLYWYDQYQEFIVVKTGFSHYRLITFNRGDEEAIFYINRYGGNNLIYWSIENHVTDASCYFKKSNTQWERTATTISLDSNRFGGVYLHSKNPNEAIVFSTVDFYSDETGTLLARPKDYLPETLLAPVRINTNGYTGGWTNESLFQVIGEDGGEGLQKLTYSINGQDEIEIENGGMIAPSKTGIYKIQAMSYNEKLACQKTPIYDLWLDLDAPQVEVWQTFNDNTQQYEVWLSASDEHSHLASVRYRYSNQEWQTVPLNGEERAEILLATFELADHGTRLFEVFVADETGNEIYQHFNSIVEKPIPTAIHVSPSSLNIEEGETQTLDIQVEVIGSLEPDEITLDGYDDTLIAVQGYDVTGLLAGETTLTVSCRGVSTTVPVVIRPAFVEVTDLIVTPTELTLEVGEEFTLETVVIPENATDQTLTYRSLHNNIVTVRNGVVEALAKGTDSVTITTHNGIERSVYVTVLKPKEKPVIRSLTISPQPVLVGNAVTFDYEVVFDTEREATFVEERWTGDKREVYDEAGIYTVGLEVLDSNGLWSDKKEITFEVVSLSKVKVKVGNKWKNLLVSNQETPVRVKTSDGWVSLLVSPTETPVRFKQGDQWIFLKTEN